MIPKPPWSKRKSRKDLEEYYVLREGIPKGLKQSLIDFLGKHYFIRYEPIIQRIEHLARRIDSDLPRDRQNLLTLFCNDNELLLDAVDHVLIYPIHVQMHINEPPHITARKIKTYLDDARSIYDVIETRDVGDNESDLSDAHNFHMFAQYGNVIQHSDVKYEIGYRQPPAVSELMKQAISDNHRAAEHLRRAWALGFSRNADPTAACIEAVKAIEASAREAVSPKNTKATLGTMIRDMNAKPEKWQSDLGTPDSQDIPTVIGMMDMVWKGHPRHGNPDEPLGISAERCEMILHTAAILVHWFSSGRVRRAE